MAIFEAKVTGKGQVTIPLEVRKRLGIHQGDQLDFDTAAPETVIRPVRRGENPFDQWVEMRGDWDEDSD
jgi:AbrB family looped-hinge helix DNA binding protein